MGTMNRLLMLLRQRMKVDNIVAKLISLKWLFFRQIVYFVLLVVGCLTPLFRPRQLVSFALIWIGPSLVV